MTPSDLTATRQRLDLTQQALANLLGVSRATVSRWEQGRTPIPRSVELALQTLRNR